MTHRQDERGGGPSARTGSSSAAPRVGGVAVLLVLAVVAARARAQNAVPHLAGPTGGMVTDTIRVLGVAVLTAGVVLLVWGRWVRKVQLVAKVAGRRPPLTTAQSKRLVVAALIGVVVALGVQLLMQTIDPPKGEPPTAPNQPVGAPDASGIGLENIQPHAVPESGLGSYLSAFGVLAALVVLAIVLLRRDQVVPVAEGEELESAEAVARAVAAGRAAVQDRAIVDPREAIVACFAAMEGALAGLGGEAAPRAADTPEEVLRRGMASAALPERPARELLQLFHEARFSAHAMSEAHRRAADEALTELLAALDGASGRVR